MRVYGACGDSGAFGEEIRYEMFKGKKVGYMSNGYITNQLYQLNVRLEEVKDLVATFWLAVESV